MLKTPTINRFNICRLLLLAGFLLLTAAPAQAQISSGEAWLVTYGPGQTYWERFGHNAIWLQEPEEDLDHLINFGFFDFEEENFILNFLHGRMLYFAGAQSSDHEFDFYRDQNRNIRLQKLNLSPQQYLQLRDYLIHEVQLENRDYLYDYYHHNCSTRVRDALDSALGGVLKQQFDALPASQTFREHTRRSVEEGYWFYLGLEMGLGPAVDGEMTEWDEFFLPEMLADALAETDVAVGSVMLPLVSEESYLYRSTEASVPAQPTVVWWRYLVFGLLLAASIILLNLSKPKWARALTTVYLTLAGLAGCVLAYLWLFTDHQVARYNLNLLLVIPLLVLSWLVHVSGQKTAQFFAAIIAVGVLIVLIAALMPGGQYLWDGLAFFGPLLLTASWLLWKPHKAGAST